MDTGIWWAGVGKQIPMDSSICPMVQWDRLDGGKCGTDREIIHRYCNPWILTMRKDSLSKTAGDHPLKLNLDKSFQSKFME